MIYTNKQAAARQSINRNVTERKMETMNISDLVDEVEESIRLTREGGVGSKGIVADKLKAVSEQLIALSERVGGMEAVIKGQDAQIKELRVYAAEKERLLLDVRNKAFAASFELATAVQEKRESLGDAIAKRLVKHVSA